MVRSGKQKLYFKPDSAFEVKEIIGFIYYEPTEPEQRGHVLASDIHLYRYHVKEETADSLAVQKNDSLRADSVKADTVEQDSARRLKRVKDLQPVKR